MAGQQVRHEYAEHRATMLPAQVAAVDPVLRELAARAGRQLPQLTTSITDEILRQMDVYGSESTVSRAELTRSVAANLQTMIVALWEPDVVDLAQARDTGTRRAGDGVPLPEVLRAFRIGFSALWALILDVAVSSGETELRTLIAASSRFWYLIDQYLEAVTGAYREANAELLRAQHRRRAALLEAVFTGGVVAESALWEVAQQLGLPHKGTFVVVAAETGVLAGAALTGVERSLAEELMASAWRLTPSYELGIVALGSPDRLPELVELLGRRTTVRIGVSPPYTGLENTPRALHLAQIAGASVAAGQGAVVCFDDSPLSVLVAAAPDQAIGLARRVLAPILQMPGPDQELLLETVEVWIGAGGSASAAGTALFCHPNTVRYRLHRVESELGLSLTDPLQLSQLVVALRSWRMLANVSTIASHWRAPAPPAAR